MVDEVTFLPNFVNVVVLSSILDIEEHDYWTARKWFHRDSHMYTRRELSRLYITAKLRRRASNSRWTCETKSTINGRALPSWSERYPNRPEHMILATIPAFKAADEMLQYFRCEREVEPGTWSAEDQLNALRKRIPDLTDSGFSNLLQLYLQFPSIRPEVAQMVLQGGPFVIEDMTSQLFECQRQHLRRHPALLTSDPCTGDGSPSKNHHLCILPGYSAVTAGIKNKHWFVLSKSDAASVLAAGKAFVDALLPPRAVAPAPRAVAPAPRAVAPAPRAVAPAPRAVAPAPRAVAPAPTAGHNVGALGNNNNGDQGDSGSSDLSVVAVPVFNDPPTVSNPAAGSEAPVNAAIVMELITEFKQAQKQQMDDLLAQLQSVVISPGCVAVRGSVRRQSVS